MAASAPAESGPGTNPLWGDVTRLDDRLGWHVDIAIDRDGNATAVYSTNNGAVRAVSKPAGKPWRGPVVLGQGRNPQVQVDAAGGVLVAWRRTGPGPDDGFRLVVARRSASGAWGEPRYLSPPVAGTEGDPSIPGVFDFDLAVAPDGAAVAVWNIARSHGEAVERVDSRYKPTGGPWLPREVLATGEDLPFGVDAAIHPDGEAIVLHGTPEHAVVVRERPATGQWTDPVPMSVDGIRAEVAVGGGVAVVAWSAYHEEDPPGSLPDWLEEVSAARRSTTGEWSAPQVISPIGATLAGVVVDRDGVGTVAWQPDGLESRDVVDLATRSSESPGAWATAEQVTQANGVHSAHLVTNPRGDLFVVYLTDVSDALLGAGRPVDGAWTSLGSVAAHPYDFDLAARPGGRALAVWGMPGAVKARSSVAQ